MGRFLISGPVHVKTTARVEMFPLEQGGTRYSTYGVTTTVDGVGYNLSRAMTRLGDEVRFASFIGRDGLATMVQKALHAEGVSSRYVLGELDQTVQSIVLSDGSKFSKEIVDLKGVQDLAYPEEILAEAMSGCSLGILCETGLSHHVLEGAQRYGLPLALFLDERESRISLPREDEDPLAVFDIVFATQRDLPETPEQWIRGFRARYGPEIVIVSLGVQGAIIWVRSDNFIERLASTRGDPSPSTLDDEVTLFSAFIHGLERSGNPYESLEQALNLVSDPSHRRRSSLQPLVSGL